MSDELITQLREELSRTRAELRTARGRILAMEASSFWRLRNAWWRLKSLLTGAPFAEPIAPVPEEPLPPPAADPFTELLGAELSLPADARVARGNALRFEAQQVRDALRAEGRARFAGRRVLFVLPVAERGGGANIVLAEARALRLMGVDAQILNLPHLRAAWERSYPQREIPVLWATPERLPEIAAEFHAVVATANTSVAWLAPLAARGPVLGYYVQDYEPLFYPPGSREEADAKASYTLVAGMKLVTKTEWNREIVLRETGAAATVIGASFDCDTFRLQLPAPPERPFRVAAMIRPSSPRRGPERTMRVLSELKSRLGDGLEVFTFGVDARDFAYRQIAGFPHHHLGVLDDTRLAALLGRVHVFADFSDYQAMGLTALEAMACGATAILPAAGGARSFARDGENALVVETASDEPCRNALLRLASDAALRQRLMEAAPRVARESPPERTALRLAEALLAR